MIGCDVLEPEPEPWGRRRVVASPEFLQLVEANLELWVREARQRMDNVIVVEALREAGVSEATIASVLV
jgi:hypothetical protein